MSSELARIGWAPMVAMYAQGRDMFETLSKADGAVPAVYIEKPAAIFACIAMGAEMGVGPMQSLRSIYVVDGKPTLSSDLMLAIAIERGIKHQWLETTDKVARLKLNREGFEPHEHSFSIEEASNAGLMGKSNWKRYPAAMLRARCLSAAMRAFCPDVMGAGVYVEGELGEPEPMPAARVVTPEREAEASRRLAEVDVPEMDETVEGETVDETVDESPPEMPKLLSECETEAQHRAWWLRNGCDLNDAQRAKAMAITIASGVPESVVTSWAA